MGGTGEFHTTGSALHALGFATGAALCVMLAVMQWRAAQRDGTTAIHIWMWFGGLLWTAGCFVWMMMLLAGMAPGSPPVIIAQTIAWTSTCIGQAALAGIVREHFRMATWLRDVLFWASTVTAAVVFGMFWAVPLVPGFPLDTEAVAIIAFIIGAGFMLVYLPLLLRGRRGGQVIFGRGFLLAAISIGAAQMITIALSIVWPDVPVLRGLGSAVGAQWAIPWAVFAGAFLARAHYADVVLKRSLVLIGSVLVAALATWLALGSAADLRFVLASLTVAGLILATPVALRGLDWIIDSLILRRPDYRELARAFTEVSRHAVGPDELFTAAAKTVGQALHLGAKILPESVAPAPGVERIPVPGAAHVLDLTATTGARALLREERVFLDRILIETGRRLDAIAFERERAERQLREGRLQHAVTQAELKALRAQVDPHFLFNTLNAIADLVGSDPAKAEAMTERLAAFFRYTLNSQHRQFSTLDEELEFARQYLDIEQARFGDRLRVEFSSDAGLSATKVPSLILQPLVENAVRHGLAPKREGGCIQVSARREGGMLQLEVADDGVGMSRDARRNGVGLENVRARLDALYGDASRMNIDAGAHGRGTRVRLLMPAHEH